MKLIFEGLLLVCACMWTSALFQIEITPQTVLATAQPVPSMNKTNYGYQLESNVTHGNTINEIAYKNPQHGIFMLFPSNWTFSTSGLPEYNQIAAFYAHCKTYPIQFLRDSLSL